MLIELSQDEIDMILNWYEVCNDEGYADSGNDLYERLKEIQEGNL
jgi:hypothetical protein